MCPAGRDTNKSQRAEHVWYQVWYYSLFYYCRSKIFGVLDCLVYKIRHLKTCRCVYFALRHLLSLPYLHSSIFVLEQAEAGPSFTTQLSGSWPSINCFLQWFSVFVFFFPPSSFWTSSDSEAVGSVQCNVFLQATPSSHCPDKAGLETKKDSFGKSNILCFSKVYCEPQFEGMDSSHLPA